MKCLLILTASLCLSVVFPASAADSHEAPGSSEEQPAPSHDALNIEQEDFDRQFCYALGLEIADKYGRAPEAVMLDPDIVARGIADKLQGQPAMSDQHMVTILTEGVYQIQIVEGRKNDEFAKENAAFLENNRRKEGVQIAPSGLQYVVLHEGEGRQPQLTDMVRVHYTGTLIDGTQFDSSRARGEPAVFSVQGVIEGWKEALLAMKEGARWQLFVPAELAYERRGDGGKIPPNAVLIFDLELLDIQ